MKFEIKTSENGSSNSPTKVFRKWVIIGAVLGALLVGVAGAMLVGAVMVAGGVVGAAFGAVYGLIMAVVSLFRRD